MCDSAAQYFCLLCIPLPLISVKLNSKLKYCICLFYKIALILYIVAELYRVKADLSFLLVDIFEAISFFLICLHCFYCFGHCLRLFRNFCFHALSRSCLLLILCWTAAETYVDASPNLVDASPDIVDASSHTSIKSWTHDDVRKWLKEVGLEDRWVLRRLRHLASSLPFQSPTIRWLTFFANLLEAFYATTNN